MTVPIIRLKQLNKKQRTITVSNVTITIRLKQFYERQKTITVSVKRYGQNSYLKGKNRDGTGETVKKVHLNTINHNDT